MTKLVSFDYDLLNGYADCAWSEEDAAQDWCEAFPIPDELFAELKAAWTIMRAVQLRIAKFEKESIQ